jgi:hypothetical protein
MEYLLGSFTTFALIIFMSFIKKEEVKKQKLTVRYSQSHIFELVQPLLPTITNKTIKKRISQSTLYDQKTKIRVIIVENMAYWVKDNVFYEALMTNDGVDSETTKIVDTIGMNSVELDKMLFIMDRLREGLDDDSGSTGNK